MQTVAPVHLLPRPGGIAISPRGGHWGMTGPAYTSLESFLLARSLGEHGIEPAGLAHVANFLQAHPSIKEQTTYDPARLTPDALRGHFKDLIAEEWSNTAQRVKGQPPPMPTLEEVQASFSDKYPALVKKLYDRHAQDVLRAVREDERRLSELAREIRELEQAEQAEKARAEAQQQHQQQQQQLQQHQQQQQQQQQQQHHQPQQPPPLRKPTPASDVQPHHKPPNGRGPSPGQASMPTPTPGKPSPPAPVQHTPPPPRNIVPTPTPGVVQPPHVVPPVQVQPPVIAPGGKIQPALKPHGAPGQVLQPPAGVGQQPPRGIQSNSPVPLPAISPRPDSAKPKTPGPPPPAQQQAAPGTLKWEKPYQPPGSAPQGRPTAPQMMPGGVQANAPPGQPQYPPQWQQPPAQHPQNQQPLPPQQPVAPAQQRPAPVLMPPQPAGQFVPPPHAGAGRGAVPHPQQVTRPASTTPIPAPVVPPARATPPQPQGVTPGYQNRPLAAATPAHSPTPPPQHAAVQPPPRRPQQQVQAAQYTPSQFSPTPPPTNAPVAQADTQRQVGSPYANQPPRPALPPHIASQVPGSPSPVQRASSAFAPPKTPVASTPTFVRTGSGTKWTATSTASTPAARPSLGDFPSPAYEPLSPVLQQAKLHAPTTSHSAKKPGPKPEVAKSTPTKDSSKPTRSRGRPPRLAPKEGADNTPSRSGPVRRSQSVTSQADELSMVDPDVARRVKNEESTPRPHDEAGDTTADESLPSRRRRVTPGGSRALHHKRKRQDTPPEPLPPASTPTHVLWTRQFGKISSSALDQISSHRCANQFAHPIRERDAPGYRSLVLQPQDIKSIRAAMTHGNRAAIEAAKSLPDGDPGTTTVWLPINEDLLPPKSIINSEQLERELVHMFSNAIMYNLDPYRGPGKSFLRRPVSEDDGEAEPSTYLVDEDAVVRDSRIMFMEVERLLGDLRAAERERSGLPPSATSVSATPAGEGTPSAAPTVDDDMDELAGEDGAVTTVKRRRIGTRA